MMTCKDCLHFDVCDQSSRMMWAAMEGKTECDDFKDRSRYVVREKGEQVEKPNPWGQDGSHSYDCSICGERTCVVGHKLRYCPNCGADMRKGENDG